MTKRNRKTGFTLMEIMVVIIVIAVLASVSGPMIGSIVDQGRTSATKSKIDALKKALIAYQSDVGRLPFDGKASCKSYKTAYDNASGTILSYLDAENNVLTTNQDLYGGNIKNYDKKWKGPYMDSDPSDFMFDAWGNPIRYVAEGKNLFLWSTGPDSEDADDDYATNAEEVYKMLSNKEKTVKSIIVSVKKFKRRLK